MTIPRMVSDPRQHTIMADVQGWVYFIRSEQGGPIKIGWARDAERRLKDMQAVNPFRLKIMARLPGTIYDEKQFHEEFAANRVHGEWFTASAALLGRIAKIPPPTMKPTPRSP